jgi:hypothetical protein
MWSTIRTLFVRLGFLVAEHPQGSDPIGQGEGQAVQRAPEKPPSVDDKAASKEASGEVSVTHVGAIIRNVPSGHLRLDSKVDDDSDLAADFDAAARLEPASGEAPELEHCTPGMMQRMERLGEVRMALEFFDLPELQVAAKLICTNGKCAEEMNRLFDDAMKLRTFLQRTVEDMDLRTLVRIADRLEHMGFHQLGQSSD